MFVFTANKSARITISLFLVGAFARNASQPLDGSEPRSNLKADVALMDGSGAVLRSWSDSSSLLSGALLSDALPYQVWSPALCTPKHWVSFHERMPQARLHCQCSDATITRSSCANRSCTFKWSHWACLGGGLRGFSTRVHQQAYCTTLHTSALVLIGRLFPECHRRGPGTTSRL